MSPSSSPDGPSGRHSIDFLGHNKENQKRMDYRSSIVLQQPPTFYHDLYLWHAPIKPTSFRPTIVPQRPLTIYQDWYLWHTTSQPTSIKPSTAPQQPSTLSHELYLWPAISQPTSFRHLDRPPVISDREVDPPFALENLDPAFHLRGLKRTKRYENLATCAAGLGLDPGSTWDANRERVEHSIRMTVANMTKNYHMAVSQDETLSIPSSFQPIKDVKTDAYSFEKDQMETWDSVIRGIKVQQEVCHSSHPLHQRYTFVCFDPVLTTKR